MKITKKQLKRIIKEEKARLMKEQREHFGAGADPSVVANQLLDSWMTSLENKLYRKYPDEQVDEFAVEAMAVVGKVEALLVKLITGGYKSGLDDYDY